MTTEQPRVAAAQPAGDGSSRNLRVMLVDDHALVRSAVRQAITSPDVELVGEAGLDVSYERVSVHRLAAERPASFDLVTCMEMLEHVPDPASVIRALADLLKPGGQVFLSTLNRTPMAFALGILGAEYVARLLPRGTHRYDRFIRPSELAAWLRDAGLVLRDVTGLHYNPLARSVMLGGNVRVNYLAHAEKPAA
mgnify:CR=1 FL=1